MVYVDDNYSVIERDISNQSSHLKTVGCMHQLKPLDVGINQHNKVLRKIQLCQFTIDP